MTEELCTNPSCAYPRPEGSFICRICVQVLEQDLGSVPALLTELTITMCRLDNLGVSARSSGEQSLPYKERASDAKFVLENTVGTWARDMAERAGVQPPAGHVAASRWMLRNVDSLAMNPASGEAVAEIRSAVHQAYDAIDRPVDLLAAGPCGAELAPGVTCARKLYVQPDLDMVRCPDCGARHDVETRQQWMLDCLAEMRVTKRVALDWIDRLEGYRIPDVTFRSWVNREQVKEASLSVSGHPLYRFGDVRGRAKEWRTRTKLAVA